MYYYKALDQLRGNYKGYYVEPVSVGGLSRTHKIIRMEAAKQRIEAGVMAAAFAFNRAEQQRNERKAKRVKSSFTI